MGFLSLLRRNKHPHPLIYMRGLKSEDIRIMLDFFYYGEANADQENLDTFLALAEELEIKGFNKSRDDIEDGEVDKKLKKKQKKPLKLSDKDDVNLTNPVSEFETEFVSEQNIAQIDPPSLKLIKNESSPTIIEKPENFKSESDSFVISRP